MTSRSFLTTSSGSGRAITPWFLTRSSIASALVAWHQASLITLQEAQAFSTIALRSAGSLAQAALLTTNSLTVADSCQRLGASAFDARADVREIVGKGLELVADGHVYRLGASAWAVGPVSVPSIALAGAVVAAWLIRPQGTEQQSAEQRRAPSVEAA